MSSLASWSLPTHRLFLFTSAFPLSLAFIQDLRPLHYAAAAGHGAIVTLLLRHGGGGGQGADAIASGRVVDSYA